MDAILTIAQIETQFDAEWILVGNPETNSSLEVQSGTVLWHSKDRDEVYAKALTYSRSETPTPKRFAILYTALIPEDTAIVL
jgi:hypothetical protein